MLSLLHIDHIPDPNPVVPLRRDQVMLRLREVKELHVAHLFVDERIRLILFD